MGGKPWEPKQTDLLLLRKEQGVPSKKISREFRKQFNVVRTPAAIDAMYSSLISSPNSTPQLPIGDKRLLRNLKMREDSCYQHMLHQADIIKRYDFFEKSQNMTLKDARNLPKNERDAIQQIFLSGKSPSVDVGTIELIALPVEVDNLSKVHLILPVYASENEQSKRSLASSLSDTAAAIMSTRLGYELLIKTNFRELTRFDFRGHSLDNQRLSEELTKDIKKEHPTIDNILVKVDNPSFYSIH